MRRRQRRSRLRRPRTTSPDVVALVLPTDWNTWLERGRALLSAPPLNRADKSKRGLEDPKWALGDLVSEIPDHLVDRFSRELTGDEKGLFRQYKAVALAWPANYRTAASWTAHRELKDHPNRFELITPGMTMRAAAIAAGKKPFDLRHPRLEDLDTRAERILSWLTDKALNERVAALLAERRAGRRQRRLVKLADDERSAEYKEALANLRRAQNLKSPETAYLEVVFKLQQSAEYVRAVLAALNDTESLVPLVPEHRRPDLIYAIEALVDVALEALHSLKNDDTRVARTVIDVEESRSRIPELLESATELHSDQ